MSFSPDDYIKSGKSPVQKMVNTIVNDLTSGMPNAAKSITSNISTSLLNNGVSFSSAKDAASLAADSVISGAAGEYQALASKITAKGIGSGLNINKTIVGTKDYFSSVNPASKIKSKNAGYETIIVAVI